jgi:KUP system potassium uptake protein
VVDLALYLDALHWTAVAIGLVLSINGLFGAALRLLVGTSSDRLRRKPFLLAYEAITVAAGAAAVFSAQPFLLGALSLIFWSLTIIISVKYSLYVMQADNEGEGGILALMALLVPSGKPRQQRWLLVALGVFGAALLYGDGMITPAISVLSVVGGLQLATPIFDRTIVPITVILLIGLFLFQRRGTRGVGLVFGPVMLLWFCCLAALGIVGVVRVPQVLRAIDPLHGLRFFAHNGWTGFVVLGTVFLAVTGGEALYADMSHFGKRPIRLAWFSLVFCRPVAQLLWPGGFASGRGQRHHPAILRARTSMGTLSPGAAGLFRHA